MAQENNIPSATKFIHMITSIVRNMHTGVRVVPILVLHTTAKTFREDSLEKSLLHFHSILYRHVLHVYLFESK